MWAIMRRRRSAMRCLKRVWWREPLWRSLNLLSHFIFNRQHRQTFPFFTPNNTPHKQFKKKKKTCKRPFYLTKLRTSDACCLQKLKSNHSSEAAQIAKERNWWRINIKWATSCIMELFKRNLAKDRSLQIARNIHHRRWMDMKQQPPI